MLESLFFPRVFPIRHFTLRLSILISVLLTLTLQLAAQNSLNVNIKADTLEPKTIVTDNGTSLVFRNTLKSTVHLRCNGVESAKFDIDEGKTMLAKLKIGEYKCELAVGDKTINVGTIKVGCAPASDGKGIVAKVSFEKIDISVKDLRLGDWFEFTNMSDKPLSIKSVEGSFDTGELAPGQASSIRPTKAGRNDLIVYRGASTGARLSVVVTCP